MEERKIFNGAEFIITDVKSEDVFTPEDFTKEHKMVLKATVDFVKKELSDNADEIEEKVEKNVRKWFKTTGDLGLNGIDISEDIGGEGLDKVSACLVAEGMAGAPSFVVSHVCHTGIGSLPIVLFGNDEQKKKYIPKLASGEYIGAYCLTESGAGSDAMNAATTAKLSDDGKFYILNGEKIFITNGAWADVLTVFAKVDGEHFTGFIVEKGFEGFSVGSEEKKLGIKGSSTVSVILRDCMVPVENVLYEVGQGHKIAFNVLNIGRYKLGASTMGGAKTALATAVKYANQREQFGKKISSFGMIKTKLAEMSIGTYISEALVYRLAAAIEDKMGLLDDEAKKSGSEIAKSIEEYSIECAIVKVYCSESLDFVVDELVQIYGGNGFIAEYPAERAYRDSRINRIFEGTNEINRLVITGNLLKNVMKNKLDLFTAINKAAEEIKSYDSSSIDYNNLLAPEENILKMCKNIFLIVAGSVADNILETLSEEQEVISMMADLIIEIYAIECGILRAGKCLKSKGEKKAELHIAAVKVYLAETLPKIVKSAKQIMAFIEKDDVLDKQFKTIDTISYYKIGNIVELKRKIADKVIKGNKYPF